MSETEDGGAEAAAPKRKSKLLLIAGALSLVLGGGGFAVVYLGVVEVPFLGALLGKGAHDGGPDGGHGAEMTDGGHDSAGGGSAALESAGYVELDPMVITLGPNSRSRHLQVTLTIEVESGREHEVEATLPRIVDTLQGFMRAVDAREFEVPRSMERLRAQMLRRVRLVAPENVVRDLLIQQFLLN